MNIAISPNNSSRPMHRSYFSDDSLACRLDCAEATANARFMEARAHLELAVGAQWIEVAGAYAMYDGVRSPCTQTFGLGLFSVPTEAEMERIERFFTERHAPIFHEVSPLADGALVPMLNKRGYRPVEFSTVMFLPLGSESSATSVEAEHIQVRIITDEERDLWAHTADLMFSLMRINAFRSGGTCFLAELRGQPIATEGGWVLHATVPLLVHLRSIDRRFREARRQAGLPKEMVLYCARHD